MISQSTASVFLLVGEPRTGPRVDELTHCLKLKHCETGREVFKTVNLIGTHFNWRGSRYVFGLSMLLVKEFST